MPATPSRRFFQGRRKCLATSIAALVTGAALWLPDSSSAAPSLPTAYWTGNQDAVWSTNNTSNTNWATSATGTPDTGFPPNSSTDVFFSATGALHQSTTLGQDFTINSLTINDPTAVVIGSGTGGPYTLTLNATNPITVNSGAGSLTISANVDLEGAGSTITVGNTAGALISGIISGSNGLTKAGSGTLTLTAANTFTGGAVVNAGTLQLGDGIAVASLRGNIFGPVVVVNNGAAFAVMANATITASNGSIGASGPTGMSGAAGTVGLAVVNFINGGTLTNQGTLTGGFRVSF